LEAVIGKRYFTSFGNNILFLGFGLMCLLVFAWNPKGINYDEVESIIG
jgi:hypothetical protein